MAAPENSKIVAPGVHRGSETLTKVLIIEKENYKKQPIT